MHLTFFVFLKYYITPDAGCQCFFDVFARNFLPKACIFSTLAATLSAVRTVRRGGALHGELQNQNQNRNQNQNQQQETNKQNKQNKQNQQNQNQK